MGHYISEMDPDFGSEDREIRAAIGAGFKSVSFSNPVRVWECPYCGALVKNWYRHQQVCPPRLGNEDR